MDIENIVLISPKKLKSKIPVSQEIQEIVTHNIKITQSILNQSDTKILIFECSNTNTLNNFLKLKSYYHKKIKQDVFYICCINLTNIFDSTDHTLIENPLIINHRLLEARQLLLSLTQSGVACAIEVFNPLIVEYLNDLICWSFVDSSNIENQYFRLYVSAVTYPVAYRCSNENKAKVAINSLIASRSSNCFVTINEDGKVVKINSSGNKEVHLMFDINQNSVETTLKYIKNNIRDKVVLNLFLDEDQSYQTINNFKAYSTIVGYKIN